MEHQRYLDTDNARLALTLHYPAQGTGEGAYPLTLICHGFTGSRIGADRLFVQAARRLSDAGHLVVRFDYGGCGESTGDYGAGGLDRLVEETRRVLDYALRLESVDLCRVTLLGHSLGGAVAALTAARDKRVKRLALWAPVAYPLPDITRIIGPRVHKEILARGVADYLGYALTDRFLDSLAEGDPLQELRRFRGSVLAIHGTSDEVIASDAAAAYQRAGWLRSEGETVAELLPRADHSFTGAEVRDRLFSRTEEWLRHTDPRSGDWNHWSI